MMIYFFIVSFWLCPMTDGAAADLSVENVQGVGPCWFFSIPSASYRTS